MIEKLEHKPIPPHIYNLRFWVKLTEPDSLKSLFDNLLKKTDFKILNFSEHYFPVQGYTAIWLLAESHLAIHTFPTEEWSYIELSGCNKSKTQYFKDIMLSKDILIYWDSESNKETYPLIEKM